MTDNDIQDIRNRIFQKDKILNKLKSLGLNSNWDMLFIVFSIHLIDILKKLSHDEIEAFMYQDEPVELKLQNISTNLADCFNLNEQLPLQFLDNVKVGKNNIYAALEEFASTVEAQEKVAISVSNEIIEILIDGTVTHAVNAPKMDLSNIDDTVKSFINLSQTVGELAIQLMYNAPSSIKITYGGDLASIDSSLLTRTIITHILKDDLGPEVNIINALMLLNQQQVTLNIENNKAETGFSNYLEVELSNDSDSVKVGASVFTGFGPRIVRINNFSVDLKPNQYQIVSYHNDTPGMVGKTGALLGKYNINIASMTLGRTEAGGDALMILSVDQPVSNNIIDELKQVGEYNQIFTTELTVQS